MLQWSASLTAVWHPQLHVISIIRNLLFSLCQFEFLMLTLDYMCLVSSSLFPWLTSAEFACAPQELPMKYKLMSDCELKEWVINCMCNGCTVVNNLNFNLAAYFHSTNVFCDTWSVCQPRCNGVELDMHFFEERGYLSHKVIFCGQHDLLECNHGAKINSLHWKKDF